MMKEFITEQYVEQAVKTIKRVVDIPSVMDEENTGAGYPLGKGVVAALDEALAIAEELGFSTYKDPEGYYGYAEIGAGEKTFGIVGHLDVVPAGDFSQWDTDPFDMQVIDGKIVGRGTQDDKGPTFATMIAIKALLDAGVEFAGKIRFIFGTDEENLWRCMKHYNEHEEGVDLGFVPDSEFPLTYAEKGLLDFDYIGAGVAGLTLDIGGAYNAVPSSAQVTLEDEDAFTKVTGTLDELGYAYETQGLTVTVAGKAAHAMNALQGTNAVTRLGRALATIYPDTPVFKFLTDVDKAMEDKTTIFGEIEDEASGKMAFNLARVQITPEQTKIALDIRIPVTIDFSETEEMLSKKAAEYSLEYHSFDYLPPLYVERDSELVQTLLKVYNEFTGEHAEAEISGGATFARTIKNCVAFGAMLPTTPDFMHQPNEQWSLADMQKAMEIYANAVYELFSEN